MPVTDRKLLELNCEDFIICQVVRVQHLGMSPWVYTQALQVGRKSIAYLFLYMSKFRIAGAVSSLFVSAQQFTAHADLRQFVYKHELTLFSWQFIFIFISCFNILW